MRVLKLVEVLGWYSKFKQVFDKLSNLPDRIESGESPTVRERHLRLREDEQVRLVADYKAGLSVYELGDKYQISRKTVSVILKRRGIKLRYNLIGPTELDQAKRLYESGASYATIGNYLKVDPSTVRKALLGAEVESRPVGTNQWA